MPLHQVALSLNEDAKTEDARGGGGGGGEEGWREGDQGNEGDSTTDDRGASAYPTAQPLSHPRAVRVEFCLRDGGSPCAKSASVVS